MESLTPDLFHIDYSRLLETLVAIIVLSFFIERILAMLFESRMFIEWANENKGQKEEIIDNVVIQKKTPPHPKKKGVKELITILLSVGFCIGFKFDAFTIILQTSDKMTLGGMILTGFLIAGGSKASIKLFHDVMEVMSNAERERKLKP